MKTDNSTTTNTAPFKPQEQYVDALLQRVTDNALQHAKPAAVRPIWKRTLTAAAAAAVIVVAGLSVYFFNPTPRPHGEKLASVSTTVAAPADKNLAEVEAQPEQTDEQAAEEATPAAATTTVKAHAAKTANLTAVDEDPIDKFLDTLDDDQLAAIDYSYIDEIPEY